MSWIRLAAVALVSAVALVACDPNGDLPDIDVVAEAAETPPPRDAHLYDGGWPEAAAYIAREAADGRPTVVNVFAEWCGPCKAEAPVLRAAIAAHPDVAWLGVDHQDRKEAGEAFLREERIGFDATIYDVAGDIAINVASRGMPTTAFFDHDGRLVFTHTGVLTEQMLAQRLADLEAAAGL